MAAFRAGFERVTMIEQVSALRRLAPRSLRDRARVRPYLSGSEKGWTLYLHIEVKRVLPAAGYGRE